MKSFKIIFTMMLFIMAACSRNSGTTDITIYEPIKKEGATYYVAKSSTEVRENEIAMLIASDISNHAFARTGEKYESVVDALLSAKEAKSSYLIYPVVQEWSSDTRVGSSEKAKAGLEISIYDVETSNLVNRTVISRECIYEGFKEFSAKDCLNINLWLERVIQN